jgi:hypothetical protein
MIGYHILKFPTFIPYYEQHEPFHLTVFVVLPQLPLVIDITSSEPGHDMTSRR